MRRILTADDKLLTAFRVCLCFRFRYADRVLLHQLVAVPHEDRQVYAGRHSAGPLHPRHIRLRLAQEEQADELRVERRDKGWQDRPLREDRRTQEGQPVAESSPGYR